MVSTNSDQALHQQRGLARETDMGDKSPKNMKKRALRVAQKGKPAAEHTADSKGTVIDALAKPTH